MIHKPVLTPAGLVLAACLACCTWAQAPARPVAPPLGLPRLAPDAIVGQAPTLAPGKAAVDQLGVETGARGQAVRETGDLRWLELEPRAVWTRPLAGAPARPHFVSFLLYASPGTEMRVGGVLLRVEQTDGDPWAELKMAVSGAEGWRWRALGVRVPLDLYEGRLLAGFHVMTIRLDPAEGTWDLYLGARLASVGLPLLPDAPRASRPTLGLRAGIDGARLLGLVQSSEHPLYEDANDNGVDDAFERRAAGRLAPQRAPASERHALARAWQADPGLLPTLFVRRPMPDRP